MRVNVLKYGEIFEFRDSEYRLVKLLMQIVLTAMPATFTGYIYRIFMTAARTICIKYAASNFEKWIEKKCQFAKIVSSSCNQSCLCSPSFAEWPNSKKMYTTRQVVLYSMTTGYQMDTRDAPAGRQYTTDFCFGVRPAVLGPYCAWLVSHLR
jgi:hypothetical protein